MSYPGKSSLPQDVQERILGTFAQSLDLIEEGKEQEAKLGCEFVLGMDPLFKPAQTLLERIQSGERPVATQDLRSGDGASTAQVDLDDLGDLDDLDALGDLDDLGDLEPAAPPSQAAAPAAGGGAASALGAVIQDLLAKRNYPQVLQIAESQKEAIMADPQLQRLVAQAQEKQESAHYVETFVEEARNAKATGQIEEFKKALEKIRSLDPEHPALEELDVGTGPEATSPVGEQIVSFDDEEDDGPMLFADDDDSDPASDPFGATESQQLDMETMSIDDDLGALQVGGEEQAPTPSPPQAETPPAPPAPPAAPPAAEPAAAIPSGESDRITQLLTEGQEAFDQGENQTAIDIWSRIFLIDLDNEEASRRIEAARNRKAELERQAEETFHEAISQIEGQSIEGAKGSLRQVLELQPNHSLAREYLEQLEDGKVPAVARPSSRESADVGDFDPDQELADLAAASGVQSDEEAARSLEAAVQRDRVVVVKKTDWRPIALGALVLVAIVAGGWFLLSKWDELFPNADNQAVAPVRRTDQIARATTMHEEGNTEGAIRVLEQIPAVAPQYEKAQALAAQWKALVETPAEVEPTGPAPEVVERQALLAQAAREAHGTGQYLRARRYFTMAGKLIPLGPEEEALLADSESKLSDLEEVIALYEKGEYTKAIPTLWRLREERPADPDVQLLLVDAYYNLAVLDLQRNQPSEAAKKFRDALEADPEGRDLERLLAFAESYERRQEDLLYRIFVKYLPERKL